MDPIPPTHEIVFDTARPEAARLIERALQEAGIRYEVGLQSAPEPRVLLLVHRSRGAAARRVIAEIDAALRTAADVPEPRPDEESVDEEPSPVPWGVVRWCGALVLAHLALVWIDAGARPLGADLVRRGALVGSRAATEPWRLVSHLVLHVDPPHVLWNGLSLIVFAVPVVGRLGWLRTTGVYLLSGIAGGTAALATYPPETVTVGSSGAVAGLFGAWLVDTLVRARRRPATTKAWLRAVGIGLLVLPALVTPTTATGGRISVAAHVGGAAAGAVVSGLLLKRNAARRPAAVKPE
jgi:membrane associated rhomboid family serine protease